MAGAVWTGQEVDAAARRQGESLLDSGHRVVIIPLADSPVLPNPWVRLPLEIAVLAADLSQWAAVVSRDSPISGPPGGSLNEWVSAAIEQNQVVRMPAHAHRPRPKLPELAPRDQPPPRWLLERIDQCGNALGATVRSKIDLVAVQAGLLQMGDHVEASHEKSQSIEGRGKHQAGDYWHAINHRREPDDGNARYWFRHVGDHPLFRDLAPLAFELANEFTGDVRAKGTALVQGGRLDPFRVVEFASEARRRRDDELTALMERLQWIEMVQLLDCTIRDAVG